MKQKYCGALIDRIGNCARMAKNQGEATMLKTLELANSYGVPVNLSRPFEQHLVEEAKLISTEARLQLVQAIEAMLKSPSRWAHDDVG